MEEKISNNDYNAIKFEGLLYSIIFFYVLISERLEFLYIPIFLMFLWIAFPTNYIPQLKIYSLLYNLALSSFIKKDNRKINFKSEKLTNLLGFSVLIISINIFNISPQFFKIILIYVNANFLLKSLTGFCFGRLISEIMVSYISKKSAQDPSNSNCFLKKRGASLYPRCKLCTNGAINCIGIQFSGIILIVLFFSISILVFVDNYAIKLFSAFTGFLTLFLAVIANHKSEDIINANFELGREITVRKHAEGEVKKARDDLEIKVDVRTKELQRANELLNLKIAESNEAGRKIVWQNKFLSKVIKSIANPFYVINAEDYSIAMSNYLGSSIKNGEGSKCFEISHNRDIPCDSNEHICPLEEVKRTKKPIVVEHIHYDEEGIERIFEVHGYPIFDEDGNVTQMIENSIDVTNRREINEAMAHLANVTEKSHDAIGSLDIDGAFTSWNKGAEEIFGYKKEEIIGKSFGFIVPDEFKHQCGDYLFTASESGFIRNVESERIAKDGRRVPVEMTISALNDNSGELIGYTFIMRDISERKKMENELLERQKILMDLTEELKFKNFDLEKSNNLKELFIDIMGHDLLNPIGIIKTTAELCLEDAPEAGDLELIFENSQRASILIENAKMFSRLENSDELEKEELNLAEIIEYNLDDLSPLINEAGMKFENNISEPIIVKANRMIEHVFINLFTNAVKYAKEGKKVIIDSEKEGKYYKISIKDFGVGIPDENKNEIFTRFKRNYRGSVKGSGLGLAIVKKLIELHGGKVWIENNPKGGSVFIIKIPMDNPNTHQKVSTGVDNK